VPEHLNPLHIVTIHLCKRKFPPHIEVCETGLTHFHIPLSLFKAMFQNTNHVKGQFKKFSIWRKTGASCSLSGTRTYTLQYGKTTPFPEREFWVLALEGFIFVGFWEEQCSALRLRTTRHEHKTRIREKPVQKPMSKFSLICGRMFNIGLMLLEPLVVPTVNFVYGWLM